MTDAPLAADYYMNAAPVVRDWAGMILFSPDSYHAPRTLDDVERILTTVLRDPRGRSVRIMGGMHSCSPIFTGETVIDTSRLPLDFTVTPNPAGGGRVEASGWMHVHDFTQRAAGYGLSLTALGGTDAQTLAGLISTNTAGATINHSVYETLAWADVLTVAANGTDLETIRIDRNMPEFNGLVTSLGAIGMITRVAFDLVPQRFFTAGMRLKPVSEILGDLDASNATYDFWRIEWLPDSDMGNFWFAQPAPATTDPQGDYGPDAVEGMLRDILKFDDKTFAAGAFLTPVLKAAYGNLIEGYVNVDATGPMRNMIPLDRNAVVKVAMAEWSISPLSLPRVMDVCQTYFAANKFPNLSTEIQCTRRDDYWMSAWNWPDLDLDYIVKLNFQYITNFLSFDERGEAIGHLKGLWDALNAAGIPFKAHWGKINFLDVAETEARYQTDPFMKLVKPLFLNDYLRHRLPLGS